ncbi:S41 family peptidase [Actinotalea sp. C106]|uniref:S41 family peptidase n=1 Tax=Actinotalea sp. C106 TaxID=2908644 RepID=UPI0020291FDE|nr:S41 family peptidase [Actinotalea sp. C106]
MGLTGVLPGVPFVLEFVNAPGAAPLLPLVRAERAEFEAVLGTCVVLDRPSISPAQRWSVQVDDTACTPQLRWSSQTRTLTSVLTAPEDFGTCLDLLHTLAHSTEDVVEDSPCTTSAEAFDRIYAEVANVYPSFRVRGLDWDTITDRHRGVRELEGEEFVDAAERWVAELGDAHTQLVRTGPVHHPPYVAEMTDRGAVLLDVPPWSDAAAAGVGAGWVVDVEDPRSVLDRTGASPQQRAMIAARRFLRMGAEPRAFGASSRDDRRVTWVEHPRAVPAVTRTSEGLQLRGFSPAMVSEVDDALSELAGREEITIDLRGNTGGNLVVAMDLRSRFLRGPTLVGSVRFSDGRGGLVAPVSLRAEPHPAAWRGRARILIDAMTYSASEDFVLGLQGLPHITVEGTPSGGGSGRPHSRAILSDLRLSVSTALTFDRTGRCIELHGIPVDVPERVR